VTSLQGTAESQPISADDLIDGRYRLIDLVHRTDMAETWRAQDLRLRRQVVIELIPMAGDQMWTADHLQTTIRERYSHLHDVYDAGTYRRAGESCTFVVTTLLVNTASLPVNP
jgi:hypothetical protein